MKLLIDADGCPVVDISIQACRAAGIPVVLLCDTAHQFVRDGAETITVDKGADSVDFALVNRVEKGDIVVTQDYGLASMCLARGGRVLNQNGLIFTEQNIGGLLEIRFENKKLLRSGRRPKAFPKRTKDQDAAFLHALERLLYQK